MSYWCDEKLVVRVSGPEGEQEIALDQPFAQIGAHARSNVVLAGPGVRKRALLLMAMEQGVYAVYLDMEEAGPEDRGRWIHDSEPIKLGPYTLTVSLASGASLDVPPWNPLTARSAPPIPVMHAYAGTILKDRRRIRHPLVMVGRRPQCALRLRGEIVSSFHCLLYWCDRRLWCIDLKSSNGTRVGDELFACRELLLNERLEVGEFSLQFYRWSPRRMTPGGQPADFESKEEVLDTAFSSPLEAPSPSAALPSSASLSEAHALLAAREQDLAAKESRFHETMAVRQSELDRQRHELQRDRELANEQWTEEWSQKASALEAEIQRLEAEREALAQSQARWEKECENLNQRLAQRNEELARLQTELANARAALATRQTEQVAAAPAAVHDETTIPGPHWRLAEREADPQPLPAMAGEISAAGADAALGDVAAPTLEERRPQLPLPTGRRRVEDKEQNELTSFVSGRLSDMEHSRRRWVLVVWATITVMILATAAAGFGLWFWLR